MTSDPSSQQPISDSTGDAIDVQQEPIDAPFPIVGVAAIGRAKKQGDRLNSLRYKAFQWGTAVIEF